MPICYTPISFHPWHAFVSCLGYLGTRYSIFIFFALRVRRYLLLNSFATDCTRASCRRCCARDCLGGNGKRMEVDNIRSCFASYLGSSNGSHVSPSVEAVTCVIQPMLKFNCVFMLTYLPLGVSCSLGYIALLTSIYGICLTALMMER